MEVRESVEFVNKGQKIFAMLHKPSSEGPFPALVICHGLSSSKIGSYRRYVTLAEALASIGVATLRLDFRGSGDSEGWATQMVLQDNVSDTLLAMRYLEQDPQISSISLLGASLGAMIAVQAASHYKNIASLALWAPVADASPWFAQWEVFLEGGSQNFPVLYEGEWRSEAFFREFFTLNTKKALKSLSQIPLLVISAARDEVLCTYHPNAYKEWREDATAESQFISLEKSNHQFGDYDDRQLLLQNTLSWFNHTLNKGCKHAELKSGTLTLPK